MTYPHHDFGFRDLKIEKVAPGNGQEKGWWITTSDGWSFHVGADSPIVPTAGISARFYGKGVGARVRGLYLDGVKVFYRDILEDDEAAQIQLYGADATDWLARWDAGDGVWSIEMGGLGPGYEQAIQITIAEILRHLITRRYSPASWAIDDSAWKRDREEISKAVCAMNVVKSLGLSGAQWGAAMSLATRLYTSGPRGVMADERVKDRHIQVSRTFPQG